MCIGLEPRISRAGEFEVIDAQAAKNEKGDHAGPQGHRVSVNDDQRLENEVQQLEQGHEPKKDSGDSQSNDL